MKLFSIVGAMALVVILAARHDKMKVGAQQTTIGGCTCLPRWSYQGVNVTTGCATPDDDPLGPWCEVVAGSCGDIGGSGTIGDGDQEWDYCGLPNTELQLSSNATTIGGCKCLQSWMFDDTTFHGCANPDDDPNGPWCSVGTQRCNPSGHIRDALDNVEAFWDTCTSTSKK